jgi:hypothetical protein
MNTDLQRYIKDDIDTRSLPEIWQTLSEPMRIDFRDDLIKRLGIASNTFYYWVKGTTKPKYMEVRRTIVKSLEKIAGLHTHAYTLFP